jgi:hypothetical protein
MPEHLLTAHNDDEHADSAAKKAFYNHQFAEN